MFVWLNGNFVHEAQGSISLRDTGLLHGAGVFTTMRSDGGRVFRVDQHLKRLRDSCEALFIPLQHPDEALREATRELLTRNELSSRKGQAPSPSPAARPSRTRCTARTFSPTSSSPPARSSPIRPSSTSAG